jgi:hypothetical protein
MKRSLDLTIYPSFGTRVLGSSFGQLITDFRSKEEDRFDHTGIAKLTYVDGWLMAVTSNDTSRYYASIIQKTFGIDLHYLSLSGSHISVIRNETPIKNASEWGWRDGQIIKFKYTHDVYTNGNHWWVNVEGTEFSEIRAYYGFPSNKKWFHLTVGRIK